MFFNIYFEMLNWFMANMFYHKIMLLFQHSFPQVWDTQISSPNNMHCPKIIKINYLMHIEAICFIEVRTIVYFYKNFDHDWEYNDTNNLPLISDLSLEDLNIIYFEETKYVLDFECFCFYF